MKITFKTKIALIMFGLFLFFVLLEAGLRFGGFVLLSMQEYRNRQNIQQKGSYRILCLGESTTQGQYPAFLEKVLNQRNIGVGFSVIDKGRGGMNTSFLLSKVESYLDEYNPNLVVVMMGINDQGKHIPFEVVDISKTRLLFKSLRTYKLIRLLWLHIQAKAQEIGLYKHNKGPFKKVIDLYPKNYNAYIGLGLLYREQDKYLQAEDSFRKAILLNPKNEKAYIELGSLYRENGEFSQAEVLCKKAVELNPKNDNLYKELGWFFLVSDKNPQADIPFKKAIELNPKNYNAHIGLGEFYLNQCKFFQAEELYKKAIELNPKKCDAYARLGRLYQVQGKFLQAEESFKKGLVLNPENDFVNRAISVLYEETNRPELAKEYGENLNRLRFYKLRTVNNYHKLKDILYKRGIRLVCVQYPMRSVELLKMMFKADEEGIIFVDNENNFKGMVRELGVKEVFRDMFAGDFGHCTEKGNRLLAENITEVILKEVFDK